MIDPISLILGGALISIGWVTGRRNRRQREPKTPKLICSCEHGYGIHKNGGTCGKEIKRANEWNTLGTTIGWEWVPCPCQSYDGPQPLPQIWNPNVVGYIADRETNEQ